MHRSYLTKEDGIVNISHGGRKLCPSDNWFRKLTLNQSSRIEVRIHRSTSRHNLWTIHNWHHSSGIPNWWIRLAIDQHHHQCHSLARQSSHTRSQPDDSPKSIHFRDESYKLGIWSTNRICPCWKRRKNHQAPRFWKDHRSHWRFPLIWIFRNSGRVIKLCLRCSCRFW